MSILKCIFISTIFVGGVAAASVNDAQAGQTLFCDCNAERPGQLNLHLGMASGVIEPKYYVNEEGQVYPYDLGQLICSRKFGRRAYVSQCSNREQIEYRRRLKSESIFPVSSHPANVSRKRTASDFVIDTFSGNRQRPPSTIDPLCNWNPRFRRCMGQI